MPTASELALNIPPKILIYGKAFTGKTTFAMSLGEKAELIDMDAGFRSAVNYDDKFKDARGKVDICFCQDTDPVKAAGFIKAKDRILTISSLIFQKKYTKQVLILDNLTTFAEGAMKYVLTSAGNWAQGKQATQQQWGQAILYVEQLLATLRQFPIPVIILAHDFSEEIEGSTAIKIFAIGKKMPSTLPNNFDEVWYSKIVGANTATTNIFQTRSSSGIVAKTRGALPDGTKLSLGADEVLSMIGWKFPEKAEVPPTSTTTKPALIPY